MIVGGGLALRTGAVIAATVALAVLLSVILAGLKFEQKLRDITSSRLWVVADEMRRRVEYGLTLGLDLSELVDVQSQVERAAAGAEILGVEVVDDSRRVLFAADRAAIGQPTPIHWGLESGLVGDGVHQQIVGDALILGAPVHNSFGQAVGEVILRSSLGGLRGRIAKVEAELANGTFILDAVTGLITLIAAFLTVRYGAVQFRRGTAPSVIAPHSAVRQRLGHGVAVADQAMAELERDLDSLTLREAKS